MAKKKRFGVSQQLTQGLSDTINVVENNPGKYRQTIIPLSRIELDPDNPRQLMISRQEVSDGLDKSAASYDKKMAEYTQLKELATTIEENGIINPIVVYKLGEKYRVVAGERRTLASIIANKSEIEARIFNEKPSKLELKLIQWAENTAREDLNLNERLGNIRDIVDYYQEKDSGANFTSTTLCEITGLSPTQSKSYLSIIRGNSDVLLAINEGIINSLDKALLINSIKDKEQRERLIQHCNSEISLKELKALTAEVNKERSPKASATKKSKVSTQVALGKTSKSYVVKAIIDSVISQPQFKSFKKELGSIDWDSASEMAVAFKKLVKMLEKQGRE